VLKVGKPDVGAANNNGATSMACELICSMLARRIGLPVPDYFIVDIPFALGLVEPDPEIAKLLAQNSGKHFGCRHLVGFAEWNPLSTVRTDTTLNRLEEVLNFDSIILNADRRDANPNLLYDGTNFALIDHSLVLPTDPLTLALMGKDQLYTDDQVRDHCTFSTLQRKQRQFAAVSDQWKTEITANELNDLRAHIPIEWEENSGDHDRMFELLETRTPRLKQIQHHLWKVVG
jgi:hypothetical protein